MISPACELAIRNLLAAGFAQAQIAKAVGVDMRTVSRIKRGQYSRSRKIALKLRPCDSSDIKELSAYYYCKSCGALLTIPTCLVCHPEAGDQNDATTIAEVRKRFYNILPEEIAGLLGVVHDLCDLSDQRIIKNHLFKLLAKKARLALETFLLRYREHQCEKKEQKAAN